jgi:uncharacterized SAM-binding protein YcdF (DUF218 family)
VRTRVTLTVDLRWLVAGAAALLVAAAGAWFGRWALVDAAAAALTVEDPLPERADAVFTHGGGLLYRVPGGLVLARAVDAETVAVTTNFPVGLGVARRYGYEPPTEAEAAAWILRAEGWTGGFEDLGPSRSTMEDAELLRRWCEANGVRTVVAVTSPPHTRRARLCHRRVFAGTGIDVRVRPASDLEAHRAIWPEWRDHAQFTAMEAARLVAYRLRY